VFGLIIEPKQIICKRHTCGSTISTSSFGVRGGGDELSESKAGSIP
jgi:hypothetical protein